MGRSIFRIEFDGLAVGGFGFVGALRLFGEEEAEVVPWGASVGSSSMALR
jgi:hypothetical protein